MEIVQLRYGHVYNVFAVVVYILVSGIGALSPDGMFCFPIFEPFAALPLIVL